MRNFNYAKPKSLGQVTSFLAASPQGAHLMGGGTDLVGEIKEGLVVPEVVIDLAAVPGLADIKKGPDGLAVGATATIAQIAGHPDVKADYPVLHQAAAVIASPQLRNVGTVGGNLCQRPRCWYYRDAAVRCSKKGGSTCYAVKGRNKHHAVFAGGICWAVFPSDLAPALVALEARFVLASAAGERVVAAADFYAPPIVNVRKETVLNRGEILREVRIPPAQKGDRSAYRKFIERGSWDFAVVSAAVRMSGGSAIRDIRIVCGGVAPVPWRLRTAEDALKGAGASEPAIRAAAAKAAAEARPLAENGYKADVLVTVVTDAVLAAFKAPARP
ncbi:MAG: xanthine dehydrogenase family protein subunit M [Candidatus Aminicenantes bacterium]|nr:xanthine dehydrogenase family protein subunit M [Candidatus Aminicenantes bacterium]